MERLDLTFGNGLAAWFYPPAESPGPCVVMAHGFGGTRGARLDAFAERFAAAGIGALVFDYRHFGDSAGDPRQLIDIARQHDDWRTAIAYARGLPEVDADRVAAWGTSFSGGHVMVIAAEDKRLAAAVSQGSFADGLATLASFGLRNIVRLTLHGLLDQFGRSAHRIPIVGPPGSLATMNTPDAEPGYLAIAPSGFRNEATARVGLRVGLYRPARKAPQITCPWLVVVADHDAICPPRSLLKAAARAPRAQVRRHDCAHFDVYVDPVFEANVADQVVFLTTTLGAATPVK